MDLPQVLLFIVIVIISVILTVIGVQIISILKEAKSTLKKVDKILEDVEFFSHNISRSTSSLQHIADGIKSGVKIVDLITHFMNAKSSKEPQDVSRLQE